MIASDHRFSVQFLYKNSGHIKGKITNILLSLFSSLFSELSLALNKEGL